MERTRSGSGSIGQFTPSGVNEWEWELRKWKLYAGSGTVSMSEDSDDETSNSLNPLKA